MERETRMKNRRISIMTTEGDISRRISEEEYKEKKKKQKIEG
jgi:hypothetical protein